MSAGPPVRTDLVARLRAAGCVFAEDEARLLLGAARTSHDLESMVERRVAGVPLEHVLGWVEFRGLRLAVEPGLFVPRQRTAFLVDQAVEVARAGSPRSGTRRVVDLCCGVGAVAAALAAALDRVQVHAVDIDPVAVRCARRNLAPGGPYGDSGQGGGDGGGVYQGDLYDPLPASLRGAVDVLVANAPYVPTEAVALLPPEARLHEPRLALDGGPDGLDVLRRVVAGAPDWLAPGGSLLVETSERQAPVLADLVAGTGLAARVARSGALNATVVLGTDPSPGRAGRDAGPPERGGR